MEQAADLLEKEAHILLAQENFAEAYRLFKKSAQIYKNQGNHKEAALCFSSAASCWAIKSGEKTFYNAAMTYEEAATQAHISGDPEYASLLYRYAAINYERDLEFINFSDCFYRSKECYREFLTLSLLSPKKIYHIAKGGQESGITKRVFLWLALTFSFLVWGHGERPARTFYSGIFLVFLSAFVYMCGVLSKDGVIFKPNFFEAFYFSMVTFTTVGFGDIIPVGFAKFMVMLEAFSALFITPIFVIGLSRKYLRV
jgi:tetratricopeptide (TPR) repeat protein